MNSSRFERCNIASNPDHKSFQGSHATEVLMKRWVLPLLAACSLLAIACRTLGVSFFLDGGEPRSMLILLRHGESEWNAEARFTGWVDVDLTSKGIQEALTAGLLMKDDGVQINVAYSSYLKRAIKACHLALEAMDQLWIPVQKSWRLNERHYGSLQGQTMVEVVAAFPEQDVRNWRRSYSIAPPPIDEGSEFDTRFDKRYAGLDPKQLPRTESLATAIQRVLPFWRQTVQPALRSGASVLIVAHGNILRALIAYLEGISDNQIMALNMPTGIPLVYKLNSRLKPLSPLGAAPGLSGRFLGDPLWVADKLDSTRKGA
mmetsp:Transcript_135590/g.377617  ORF Transcript_135590/g.377617 Transcript_135590/m.377617 type:complete len:317 (+) Transcript_135590:1-951(+)